MKRGFSMGERGSVLSAEFLIVAVLSLFLIFGATDYWLVQVKMQQAEHIKNYYLNRMRVVGCLTEGDKARMADRFRSIGCTVRKIEAPSKPLPRNSEVCLKVEVTPNQKPFLLGRFLGLDESGEFVIRVGGCTLSEVPPR